MIIFGNDANERLSGERSETIRIYPNGLVYFQTLRLRRLAIRMNRPAESLSIRETRRMLRLSPAPEDAMNSEIFTPGHLVIVIVAGLAGLTALEIVMWLIARRGWAQGNMLVAIGSLITRKRENAFFIGALLHLGAALGFAGLYLFLMLKFGFTQFPAALAAGIGFGLLHGMVVTLALVWVVSEQHPLEEFQDAGLAVGVTHIAGHAAYGTVVGLVIGLLAH